MRMCCISEVRSSVLARMCSISEDVQYQRGTLLVLARMCSISEDVQYQRGTLLILISEDVQYQ